MDQSSAISPVSGFSIALAASAMLFLLAALWFRYSSIIQDASYRYMTRLIKRRVTPGWGVYLNRYFGLIFLVVTGMFCLGLAIMEATRI